MTDKLPKAETFLVKANEKLRVYSLVSPGPVFANGTHIIELADQLILIDGQFFEQYGREFRELANSLNKPITRFYITHDHPDHYLGMGDAFRDVPVYALPEIAQSIRTTGPQQLQEKQQQMPGLIAAELAPPTQLIEPCIEIIAGVKFIFERVSNAESSSALLIKIPEAGIMIAQDILYHNAHAFITGPLQGWKEALKQLRDEDGYDIILPGHGKPADKAAIDNALVYLNTAESIKAAVNSPETYKQELLKAYPYYAAAKLIDIYSPILFGLKKH